VGDGEAIKAGSPGPQEGGALDAPVLALLLLRPHSPHHHRARRDGGLFEPPVLAQSRELATDFYERYCGGYRYRKAQLSTYERGTPELLGSPEGTFVMLYDRSRPGYPFHSPDGLTALLRSMPSELLEP